MQEGTQAMSLDKKNIFAAAAVAAASLTTAVIPAAAQESGTAQPPAPAGQSGSNSGGGQETGTSGPSNLNPGGVQGRPNGGQGVFSGAGSQVQGTPNGAAAQGNSAAGGGSVPASGNGTAARTSGANSRISVTTSNALTPIINRAQDMLRVADSRKIDAPGGAASSYSKSARALRQMLSAAGYGTAASSALSARGSGVNAASMSSMPVSSDLVTEDIRVLRSLSRQPGSRAQSGGMSKAQIDRVASLYATGSKEFFTAQLRDALFESPVQVTVRRNGSRVEGPSSGQGGGRRPEVGTAAAVRGDRPNVPFPVTLQQPQQQQPMQGEMQGGMEQGANGEQFPSNAAAASQPGPGQGTVVTGNTPGAPTVPGTVVPPGANPSFPLGQANNFQQYFPPNLNFAPQGFYGPPAIFGGFVPQTIQPVFPGYGF